MKIREIEYQNGKLSNFHFDFFQVRHDSLVIGSPKWHTENYIFAIAGTENFEGIDLSPVLQDVYSFALQEADKLAETLKKQGIENHDFCAANCLKDAFFTKVIFPKSLKI